MSATSQIWLDCLVDDVGDEVYSGLAKLSKHKGRYRAFLHELVEYGNAEIARLEHPEIKGSIACASQQ